MKFDPTKELPLPLARKFFTSLVTLVVLLGLSGIAVADHEEEKEDTLFSFGYDEENHILSVNEGPNDSLYVCQFENGTLTAQYGEADDDGVIPVDALEGEQGVKEFNPRLQHELEEGLVEATEPFAYAGEDGECRVNGVVVAGPNGQINHGQFMKAFKSLLAVKGHGCVNRYLAQSDLGKTDSTKMKTADVDPDFAPADTGEVNFLTFEADCVHGKPAKAEGDSEAAAGNGKGKSNKAEKATKPGKSGSAPGQNK
jgi:hypothetical protein